MIWEEILIAGKVAAADVIPSVASIFSVNIESVLVVGSIAAENIDNSKPIVIESITIGGDFPTKLSFYIDEEKILVDKVNKLDSVIALCRILNHKILISDNDVNPYSMNLVDIDGSVKKVFLDVDKLDDHGNYVISKFA
jgi:hypothetical protein